MQRSTLSTLLAALTLHACTCEDKTPVPFKRGEGVLAGALAPAADAGARAAPGGLTASAVIASYAEGTVRVIVEGAAVERGEGSFRASLAVDLDGDGARDAMFLGSDAQGRPRVEAALRKATVLTLGGATSFTPEDANCTLDVAQLSPLGDALAVATLSMSCAPKTLAAPPSAAIEPAAMQAPRTHRYVVTLEATPRVLLHVSLRDAGAEHTPLGVALASEDRDADGHTDVRIDLDVAMHAGPPRKLALLWFDRPSGLARDGTEPEQTLGALAAEASGHLPKDPDRALLASEAALALHARLCRERGRAELAIDDQAGLACGASIASGRAAVIRVVSLARKRALLPALDAFAALSLPAYRVDDAQKQRAARALATIPGDTEYVWREGPALRAPDAPAVRLPALGFLDEAQLLLRGPVAQSYDLGTQEVAQVALSGSVLVRDPRSAIVVTDIVRSCDGRRLKAAQATEGLEGPFAASALGAATVGARVDRAPVADPSCAPTGDDSNDGLGLSVLGFTAQGLLIARGGALLSVATPTDATSEARELAADAPAPALVSGGALSADGLRYVLATSQGVAIVTRGAATSVRLVRTPASCALSPSDAAISPSGQRIAMLCNGKVYLATLATAAAPVAAPASAPEPVAQPSATVPVTALPPPAPEIAPIPPAPGPSAPAP